MDNISHEIEDFLESLNEKVMKRAKAATHIIMKEKYGGSYNSDIYNSVLHEQIKIARKEMIEELEFEQRYKQLRHIGDIEAEQRSIDRLKSNIESQKVFQQGRVYDAIYSEEREIVNGINQDLDIRTNN